MKGYIVNLEEKTLANENFRQVLYTAINCQLVVMSLQPGEDIGEETHHLDQFIRVESGNGQAILSGITHDLSDGFVVIIPAGVKHNIINTSTSDNLKLYSVYAPPEHKDAVVHKTKKDATEEHFDGITTEVIQK